MVLIVDCFSLVHRFFFLNDYSREVVSLQELEKLIISGRLYRWILGNTLISKSYFYLEFLAEVLFCDFGKIDDFINFIKLDNVLA